MGQDMLKGYSDWYAWAFERRCLREAGGKRLILDALIKDLKPENLPKQYFFSLG